MQRKLPLSVVVIGATLAVSTFELTAAAADAADGGAAAPTTVTPTPATSSSGPQAGGSTSSSPSTVPAAPVATTTTTAADTSSDTTAGPTTTEPPQRDTVTVTRSVYPNRPWLVTGGLILAGSYVTTAVLVGTEGRNVEDSNLLIPVVGPWLNLADRNCDGCDNETRNVALVISTGVLQGVGAGMTLLSFFIPEKIEAATIQAGPVRMQVAPTQVGRSGMGIGTVGLF